jgi:hypothetical protein
VICPSCSRESLKRSILVKLARQLMLGLNGCFMGYGNVDPEEILGRQSDSRSAAYSVFGWSFNLLNHVYLHWSFLGLKSQTELLGDSGENGYARCGIALFGRCELRR